MTDSHERESEGHSDMETFDCSVYDSAAMRSSNSSGSFKNFLSLHFYHSTFFKMFCTKFLKPSVNINRKFVEVLSVPFLTLINKYCTAVGTDTDIDST